MTTEGRLTMWFGLVWIGVIALAACSGADWRSGGEVALDAGECTLERLRDDARRRGNEPQAKRIEAVLAPAAAPAR